MDTWQPDEEDWYDDTAWPEEPKTTYAEAIALLQSEAAPRTDLRIEWNGKRGPKDDARLIILDQDGVETFVRRIRSADYVTTFSGIVRSTYPLPTRHALWYPHKDSIVARLVGDYDELVNMLGRRMARLKPGSKTSTDSTLGQDVLGQLAYQGALTTSDSLAHLPTQKRTICLKPPVPNSACSTVEITSPEAGSPWNCRALPYQI